MKDHACIAEDMRQAAQTQSVRALFCARTHVAANAQVILVTAAAAAIRMSSTAAVVDLAALITCTSRPW